jgi:peptide/nickel transport system permease protein
MTQVFIRRFLMSVVLIVLVPSLTFFFEAITPGNIAENILGPTATRAEIAKLSKQMGLNRSVWSQYWQWLDGLLHGHLGNSYQTGQSVVSTLSPRLPVTISIIGGALFFAIVVGVLLGVLSATRGRFIAKVVDVGSVAGLAVPSFWLAITMVLIFAVKLRWLPATGYTSITASPGGWFKGMVLPSVALGIGIATFIAKQTRDQILAALNRDFIRTLRANGVSQRSIIFKHALRNASIPVVTVIGLAFVGALSGAVFIEQVFFLPGLGSELVIGASSHDLPIVEGVALYFTIMVVLIMLATDFAYVALDPRVRSTS